MLSRVAMIAITTSSSIRVKPRRSAGGTRRVMRSPFLVGHAVEAGALGQRIHVVHVRALARRIRRAGVAAPAPGALGLDAGVGVQRVARQPAQEVDAPALLVLDVGHALYQ